MIFSQLFGNHLNLEDQFLSNARFQRARVIILWIHSNESYIKFHNLLRIKTYGWGLVTKYMKIEPLPNTNHSTLYVCHNIECILKNVPKRYCSLYILLKTFCKCCFLQVKWEHDYEPYIVVKKGIPLFDHRFVGFGWNKVSHAILLDLLG